MELEPRDGDTIGVPLVFFFPESPFLTNGRWLRMRRKQRGSSLLAPALLASELWAVLGRLVPADAPDCLPENGRRRRFSAAPRAPWFHLRAQVDAKGQEIARQLITAEAYHYSRTLYLSNE